MNRKDFLKKACFTCGYLALSGAMVTQLESCAPISVISANANNSIISIPLSKIASNEKMKIVRTNNLDYDILLLVNTDKTYSAISLLCSHISNPLVVTKTNLNCNLHGSVFSFNGDVINGPAINPLKKFKVNENSSYINIYLN